MCCRVSGQEAKMILFLELGLCKYSLAENEFSGLYSEGYRRCVEGSIVQQEGY